MKILDRHIARAVLTGTGIVLAVLMALSSVLTLIGELDHLGENNYGLVQLVAYVLLKLPQSAYEMFPMATLLGTLFGLGGLAADRELVVMRASGMPGLRVAGAAMMGGALLMFACFVIGDLIAPRASVAAEELRTTARLGQATARIENEIWVRDGDRFINIRRLQEQDFAAGVEIYEIGESRRLVSVSRATGAELRADGWRLTDFMQTRFKDDGTEVIQDTQRVWEMQIGAGILQLFVLQPENLSSFGLYRYVSYLRRNGLETGQYEAAFWRRVLAPVTVPVMVLLAVPFVFGPLRSGGVGQRMLFGVAVGIAYYLANHALITSSQIFGLSVALMAWVPTLVLAAAALWGMRRVA